MRDGAHDASSRDGDARATSDATSEPRCASAAGTPNAIMLLSRGHIAMMVMAPLALQTARASNRSAALYGNRNSTLGIPKVALFFVMFLIHIESRMQMFHLVI